ncbi:MAG: YtpR family tRNA-binding protein, partial [Candidatus Zixiibacteriota bacterium]
MKLPYSWLTELTGIKWPVERVADRLTLCGIACEDIQSTASALEKVVVGQVLELHAVQGADKIKRALVSIGKETLQVICGAPNVAVGQKVPVATIGAKLANGMEIKQARIRGVQSSGMICSESELGISNDHSGIMVLNGNARLGAELVKVLDYEDYVMTFELTPNRG